MVQAGGRLGNYRLIHSLGEGGMGAVYLAEHTLLGSQAAIKILLPELSGNADMVGRFFNEARATALLRHPGLVQIFDFGREDSGCAYIVMELLHGESLGGLQKRVGRVRTDLLVAIGRQIASAVGAAHQHGIVHRDLKPDNVFLVPDPELSCGYRVKVLDFGIAKLTAGFLSVRTHAGQVMGTPTYMSPEQCAGGGQVDGRSDIYALACILYEMTIGRPPFVADGMGEIIVKHLYEAPAPLGALDPSIDPRFEAVVMRGLAKEPQHRQQSMEELAAELAAVVHGGRPVTPVGARLPDFGAPGSPPTIPSRPTTLTAASGESTASSPHASQAGRGRALAVLGGLAAVVMGGVLLSRAGVAGGGAAAAAGSTSVHAVAQPVVPAAPAPAVPRVALHIDSEPSGAAVTRADGTLVGVTPVDDLVDGRPGFATYVVQLSGYKEARIELPTDRGGRTYVGLKKAR